MHAELVSALRIVAFYEGARFHKPRFAEFRTQVDRLLSAKDDITLSSLQRAAALVGQRVVIELV